VQLGISTHSGESLANWLAGHGPHVPPDSNQLATPHTTGLGDWTPKVVRDLTTFNSVWATLDRGGVDRLIRTLRKARDAAYGRDE
jgi:hypothetical protein